MGVQHLTPKIRPEMLMGAGLDDAVCLPETQIAASNVITSRKRLAVYLDCGHE